MTLLIRPRAFTLIELMVAMVVTALLITMLVGIANLTTRAWKDGSDRTETFAGARGALSLIGRELQGAVIDLDLGYSVRSKERNDYVLKFIVRRKPTATEPSGIQKVAYQLAWASRSILPSISVTRNDEHPISVLVRTSSHSVDEMKDIFEITGGNEPYDWVNDWPTTSDVEDPNKTEVVAENVLGWEVNPIYFYYDSVAKTGEVITDSAESRPSPSYVDDDNNPKSPPLYITSDLKYVKTALSLPLLTSESGPRALEIRLAAIPASILPRFLKQPSLDGVRNNDNLFKPDDLSGSSLDRLLKQNMRIFDATYYLSSKTP